MEESGWKKEMKKQTGKFKDGFVKAVKREKQEEEEQRRLREKHQIKDKNILIVEKTNIVKFLVKTLGRVIRLAAVIAILILAAIGLISVIYPNVRGELLIVLSQMLSDTKNMLGM